MSEKMTKEELGNNVDFIVKMFIGMLASEDIGLGVSKEGNFVFHHNGSGSRCMVKGEVLVKLWEDIRKEYSQ